MKTQTLVLGGLAAAAAWLLWKPASTQAAVSPTGGASPPATTGGAKPAGQLFLQQAGISCSQWLAMNDSQRRTTALMWGAAPINLDTIVASITQYCFSPTYYAYGYPSWWGWGGGFRGGRGHGGHGGHGGGHGK